MVFEEVKVMPLKNILQPSKWHGYSLSELRSWGSLPPQHAVSCNPAAAATLKFLIMGTNFSQDFITKDSWVWKQLLTFQKGAFQPIANPQMHPNSVALQLVALKGAFFAFNPVTPWETRGAWDKVSMSPAQVFQASVLWSEREFPVYAW